MRDRGCPATTSASDAPAPPEGRAFPRHPHVSFSWFHRLERGGGHLARTTDISERGIGLVTTDEITTGERIFLVLSTHKGRISLIGTVMHVMKLDDASYRVGVAIEVIPPPDAALWADLTRRVHR